LNWEASPWSRTETRGFVEVIGGTFDIATAEQGHHAGKYMSMPCQVAASGLWPVHTKSRTSSISKTRKYQGRSAEGSS
jgi:hypothetical protein